MLVFGDICLLLPFVEGYLYLILDKMLGKNYCLIATWVMQECWTGEFIMNGRRTTRVRCDSVLTGDYEINELKKKKQLIR